MLLPLLLLAASVAAQSSLPATGDVTQFVTTTVSAPMTAPTGVNTMQTGDVTSRIKFLQGLEYASLAALAQTTFEVPSAADYLVCGSANAIQFDGSVPRIRALSVMLGEPRASANASAADARQLSTQPIALDKAYAGMNSTVFNWTDGTCSTDSGYFLAAIDADCLANTSVPVQGCIWAVSEHFEFKPNGTPLSLALPDRPGSGAAALHASLGAIALGAVAVLLI